jgi:magnesium chelatase family protein
VHRYQSKLSGPLMDRIDLHVEVPALPAAELLTAADGEPTERIQHRCGEARARATARQGKTNHALAGQEIDTHAKLDPAAHKFLQTAAAQLGWSARGTHRTLKIARTIADLASADTIGLGHVAEAMQYRRVLRAGV